MHDCINTLSQYLRLTPYQSETLIRNTDKYNMGRVVKRGGVLYVPYVSHGVLERIKNMVFGVRADLIGQNKMLVTNRRNVKFCKNGYYYVKIGPYTYYADAYGRAVSRDEFFSGVSY